MSEGEAWVLPEKARRVLQAAAVEAYGRPGMHVVRDQVMWRADIFEVEEFIKIAKHLHRRGWIDEADADYGILVLTSEGIDQVTS